MDNSDNYPYFKEASQLATAKYYTPAIAKIQPESTILIGLDNHAVTDSNSEIPVIGTESLATCTAIIAYNTKTKTAAIKHAFSRADSEDVKEIVSLVLPEGHSDSIHMHLVGAGKISGAGYTVNSDVDDENNYILSNLEDIANYIASSPNLCLKTYDVYDKPKPIAVAIDARTGALIRGTELLTSFDTIEQEDHFLEWEKVNDNVDGRNSPKAQERSR
jgi:hypothetical protein